MTFLSIKHSCRNELLEQSLKATPARIGVMRFLEDVKMPADANMINKGLISQDIEIDTATIYRTLDVLYNNNLIQRIDLGEGKYRYERSKNHHHHLICTSCGQVKDVSGEYFSDFEEKIRSKNSFLIKNHSLEFFGLCVNCQK